MKSRMTAAVVVVMLLAACAAQGAEGPLKGDLSPLGLWLRTDGPVAASLRLNYRGRGMLRGRLEVDFVGWQTMHWRSPELVVTPGEQERVMLLPSPAGISGGSIQVKMQFIAGRDTYELGSTSWQTPMEGRRQQVVAVSAPFAEGREDKQLEALLRALRLETYLAEGEKASNIPWLLTTRAFVAPADLPSTPLGWCAYDLVVLSGEGFSRMKERQLTALLAWVRAGGSVCIAPRERLQPYHVDFLNALSGGPFTATTDVQTYRVELGRAAAVTAADVEKLVEKRGAVMRDAAGFLWKLRADKRKALARGDGGLLPQPDVVSPAAGRARGLTTQPLAATEATQAAQARLQRTQMWREVASNGLTNGLMPRRVRLMPMSMIIAMLVLFVLLAGPADYFILGWLRRRRWTWVTFPACAVGFTLLTVVMANYYTGRNDHQRSLTFVDLGSKGQVLRTTRLTLHFVGRDRTVTTDVDNAIFSKLATGRDPGGAPAFDGVFPTHYTVDQPLRQWSPTIDREFSIGGGEKPLEIDWDKAAPSCAGGRAWTLMMSQERKRHRDMAAYVVRGGRKVCNLPPLNMANWTFGNQGFYSQAMMRSLSDGGGGMNTWVDYAGLVLSSLPPENLFELTTQISPHGGKSLEDVAICDESDPTQAILMITTCDGDDFTVYRKLYEGGQ